MRLRQTIRATISPCNTLDIRSSGQELDGAVIEAVDFVYFNFSIYSVIISQGWSVVLAMTIQNSCIKISLNFTLHSYSWTSTSSSSSSWGGGCGGDAGKPFKRSGGGGGCGEDIAWEVFYDCFWRKPTYLKLSNIISIQMLFTANQKYFYYSLILYDMSRKISCTAVEKLSELRRN